MMTQAKTCADCQKTQISISTDGARFRQDKKDVDSVQKTESWHGRPMI